MSNSNEATIGGEVYNFELLKLKNALKIESKVISLIGAIMGKTSLDEDALYDIGIKICSGLLIDGFEIKDIDSHFRGKAMLFNKVIIEGLKINFPDFFSQLNALDSGSKIKKALSETGIKLHE